MWQFLKDAEQHKRTGTWIKRTEKYNKYFFIKVQEWTEGYLSVSQGQVNLTSKRINKDETAKFAEIDVKEKNLLVEAVLNYYGVDDFVEQVDWVDENELPKFLRAIKENLDSYMLAK